MGRQRWAEHPVVESPGVASPWALRILARVLLPILRVLHRTTIEGAAHLEGSAPYVLVANHPSSFGVAEFSCFMALYADRIGAARPLAGFAHAAAFGTWPLTWVFRHIGAVPSTYAAAEHALASGASIAVFPGGDHEALRPFWQVADVDFGGRLGFLRIARKAWVPIVPMGIRGISAPLLFRSRAASYFLVWPRVFGLPRGAVSLLGLLGAAAILAWVPIGWPWRALAAWAWCASPLSFLPWLPVRVRFVVGLPIAPETLFGRRPGPDEPSDAGDDEALRRALAVVERAVRDAVDR